MRPGATWIVGAGPLFFPNCPCDADRPCPQRYNVRVFSYELVCRRCHWRTVCGRDDAIARLRLLGLLRREPDPDATTLAELFVDAATRMTCPICREKALAAAPVDDSDAEDWQAAVLCEVCRAPIPPERLEAIPGTKRCASCQGKAESGADLTSEPEYCPHCGAIMDLRVSRGSGITHYRRVCTGIPPCRV
jgi:RNA polymerase-binding transcription factor DksA